MVFGRRYWVWIWYGILLLGVVGLLAAAYWGRQTRFRNLDEIFRGIGTIAVSLGMIFLLRGILTLLGQFLLIVALACFVTAFILGRRMERLSGPHRRMD
ncbi:MAG: hypothetical protein AB7I33_17445 [Gemmatimonadales bacterium]